jgi:glutaredoxin 3
MLTLYIRPGCPYCARVLDYMNTEGIERTEKSISDSAVTEELVALGGKQQVPYLVDSEKGIQMYESLDIIEYLKDRVISSEQH